MESELKGLIQHLIQNLDLPRVYLTNIETGSIHKSTYLRTSIALERLAVGAEVDGFRDLLEAHSSMMYALMQVLHNPEYTSADRGYLMFYQNPIG